MAGGAVGAGLRYELGRIAVQRLGAGFPWGTLAVNLIGGLMMGLLAGTMMAGGGIERPLWLLLAVGLLGGFTTFSAFSFDMFAMIERGQAGLAAGYALGSVAGALGLLFVGIWIARAVAG
ncbi:MAG: fluoride exporter [Sphingomonadales bacterium]|nr:fluoride exporter [Sphingomonadales bacterium]